MADNVTIKDAANVDTLISAEEITTLNGAAVTAQEVQRVAIVALNAGGIGSDAGSAATSTVTNVASSATSVTLKALNANRRALYIFNAGTAPLYVKLGSAATTTTSFSYMIPPNGFWELPDDPIYTGIVTGIWSATGGNGANVTELTF
jgi:nitrate/nitrite transporter NarK